MEVRLDLLVAAASAGVLVYSGRLLAPTARLRPEDIIAYKSLPEETLSGGMVPFPVFREDDVLRKIRDVLDAKVGFDLLPFGTIGSVLTVIAGSFTFPRNLPLPMGAASVLAALAVGYGAGWWWTSRAGWRGKRERKLLVHCFLVWLEREVGGPQTKGEDFGLTVVSTARDSGFTLLGTQEPFGSVLTASDERAITHRVITLAREYHYDWRGDDIRKWAREVV